MDNQVCCGHDFSLAASALAGGYGVSTMDGVSGAAKRSDSDLIPVLSATLDEVLAVPVARQRQPGITRRLAGFVSAYSMVFLGMLAAFLIAAVVMVYRWLWTSPAVTNWLVSQRSWFVPTALAVWAGAAGWFILWFVPLVRSSSPLIGLVVSGYGQRPLRAAEHYVRHLRRLLRSRFSTHRMVGVLLFVLGFHSADGFPDLSMQDAVRLFSEMRHGLRPPRRSYFKEFWQLADSFVSIYEVLMRPITGRLDLAESGATDDHLGDVAGGMGNLGRAFAFDLIGRYEDAIAAYDRAAQHGQADIADLFAANTLIRSGDLAECERRLRRIPVLDDPDLLMTALRLECELACEQGHPARAVAIAERTASSRLFAIAEPGDRALFALVQARAYRCAGRHVDALAYARQGVAELESAGSPFAPMLAPELAQALAAAGRRSEAIAVAARAAAELDAGRYQLAGIPNRVAFVAANDEARALALDLTIVNSPRVAAELIESARVQGLPAWPLPERPGALPLSSRPELAGSFVSWGMDRKKSAAFAAEDGPRSAALTAAGLTPLTPPPRLDLFEPGDSELSLLASGRFSTDHVVLAQVAAAAAGPQWWWWGSWVAKSNLYWSLLGHDGTIQSGAIPMGSIEPALRHLAHTLPNPLPGERPGAAVARARSSALADPDATVALAAELGDVLIPDRLRDAVLTHARKGDPLSLVVAPAPVLGRVPFGLLGLGQPGLHFAHGAVVRLGASAALLEHVRTRPSEDQGGHVLAVVDPSDRAPLLPVAHLHQMGLTGWRWLQDASVLSRPCHLNDLRRTHVAAPATAADLGRMLRTGNPAVLAYIGHVFNETDSTPSTSSLVLEDGLLSAHDLLYDQDHQNWPMPPRVALIGCGSAGAQAPEWLGLAPAAMWAGAKIVAATTWDLIDDAASWQLADEVVGLLEGCSDPAARWREHFLDHLDTWLSGNGSAPLFWGAIQFIGLRSTA
jgi:hypothetical protein